MIVVSRTRIVALVSAIAISVTFANVAPVNAMGSGGSSGSSSDAAGSNSDALAMIQSAKDDIELGWYADAIQTLQAVVKKDKQNADAFNLLGFASRKLGRTENAAEFYAAALKIEPDHLGALEYQGELFLILDQLENANANLARLLELCGANCGEYLDLKGDIASHQGS